MDAPLVKTRQRIKYSGLYSVPKIVKEFEREIQNLKNEKLWQLCLQPIDMLMRKGEF